MTLDFVWLKRTLYDISDVITSHIHIYTQSILCSYKICIIQIFIPFFQVLAVLSKWCQAPIYAGLPGHKRVILSWGRPRRHLWHTQKHHSKELKTDVIKRCCIWCSFRWTRLQKGILCVKLIGSQNSCSLLGAPFPVGFNHFPLTLYSTACGEASSFRLLNFQKKRVKVHKSACKKMHLVTDWQSMAMTDMTCFLCHKCHCHRRNLTEAKSLRNTWGLAISLRFFDLDCICNRLQSTHMFRQKRCKRISKDSVATCFPCITTQLVSTVHTMCQARGGLCKCQQGPADGLTCPMFRS